MSAASRPTACRRVAFAAALLAGGCQLALTDLPLGDVVVCGSRARADVALTFDDGPVPTATPALLELLARKQVPATFFVIGQRVEEHPDIVRAAAEAGHEIGNHTWSHAKLATLGEARIRDELERGRVAIHAAGVSPARCLVRPPYGWYDGRVVEAAEEANCRIVVWDSNSEDYSSPGAERIVRNLSGAGNGSVFLFHDGVGDQQAMREALERVIDDLHARGFSFVRVSDLAPEPDGC